MEQRLIDANALMQDVIAHSYPLTNAFRVGGVDDGMFVKGIQQVVDEQPTIDAVPVVANDRNKLCPINHGLRCKDIDNCAFWCEWGQCAVKAIAVACVDGERTDNGR